QRRDVAVATKNLGAASDLLEVKRVEKIVRSISAAGAEDGANVVARKHFFEFPRAPLDGTGKVEVFVENGLEVEGLVAHAPQLIAANGQRIAVNVAGRGDNANGVSLA